MIWTMPQSSFEFLAEIPTVTSKVNSENYTLCIRSRQEGKAIYADSIGNRGVKIPVVTGREKGGGKPWVDLLVEWVALQLQRLDLDDDDACTLIGTIWSGTQRWQTPRTGGALVPHICGQCGGRRGPCCCQGTSCPESQI